MSNQPQTRTLQSYVDSLPVGSDNMLIGAGLKRVFANSEGLPAGGTTGQAMIKLSDEDYDAGWTGAFIQSIVQGTGITIDDADPRNPTISADASGGDVTGPAGATAGNFPALDATGKVLSDSGSKPSDFATAADGLLAQSAVQPAAIADMLETSDIGSLVQAYDANTAKTDVPQQFSKPQRASATPVTSATTMTIDLAANNDFEVTGYQHNGTLANPTNQSTQLNQKGTITITQDGSGGHTLSFGSNWKPIGSASAPSINTTAGVTSCIDYHVLSSTVIRYSLRAVGAA